MLRNYFIVAIRNLLKNKLQTLVNVTGLTIGLAAALLIGLYIRHEVSYDSFHEDSGRMYRLLVDLTNNKGSENTYALNMGRLKAPIEDQIPQVEKLIRLYGSTFYAEYQHTRYPGFNGYYAGEDFFEFFNFPLQKGAPESVIDDPEEVAISGEVKQKIFGEEAAIGKILHLNNRQFRVGGVFSKVPPNSHLQFDMVFNLRAMPRYKDFVNAALEFNTYIKFKPKANTRQAHKAVTQLTDSIVNSYFNAYDYTAVNHLQAIEDVHLHSAGVSGTSNRAGMQRIYMFALLAFIIVAIAMVNYVNLFTAKMETRSREVGLRKLTGARKRDLVLQFLGESVIVTCIAFLLALLLAELFAEPFGTLLKRNLSLDILETGRYLTGAFLLTLLIGVVSGLYPALYLSRFQISRIFQGSSGSSGKSGKFTAALVILQFAVAILLLTSVIVIYAQIQHMQSGDKGFSGEQVIVLNKLSKKLEKSYPSFKNQLQNYPEIRHVTTSQAVPGVHARSGQTLWETGKAERTGISINENRVSAGYTETYGIDLLQGRSFKSDRNDSASILLNQEAAERLGLENPLGKFVSTSFMDFEIIGIVKNFHYTSLKSAVSPLMLTWYRRDYNKNFYSVRVDENNIKSALAHIRQVVKDIDPLHHLSWFFADRQFAMQYQEEKRNMQMISAITLLAVLIAMMGLFALTSFMLVRRTREIGIRKVMGASAGKITAELLARIFSWLGIAAFIAVPVAWYVLENWLQQFAYRIEFSWWMFAISIVFAGVVAFFTTVWLTMRAANSNPADALRYE